MGHSISRISARWMTVCGLLQLLLPGPGRAVAVRARQPGEGARRVVLVHGIHDSGASMRWMRRLLESRGWEVYAISLKPNDATVSFEVMARQVEAFVAEHIPEGEKFDLVAFSMGGLVSRYYVQKLGGFRRVRRFVTLSTPNHGTAWAWLSGREGVKQMRPDSEMLRELNEDAGMLIPLDYTSIYTPFDLTILPASSSRMPVGRNVIAWVPLHPLMVMMPGPLDAVERALK